MDLGNVNDSTNATAIFKDGKITWESTGNIWEEKVAPNFDNVVVD